MLDTDSQTNRFYFFWGEVLPPRLDFEEKPSPLSVQTKKMEGHLRPFRGGSPLRKITPTQNLSSICLQMEIEQCSMQILPFLGPPFHPSLNFKEKPAPFSLQTIVAPR